MTRFDTILTHPGGAHKDEFLACSVLLALLPVPIVRREPTPEDLTSPDVAVVDVGHVHDPLRNNFDHHQLPKDHAPTCSLSLVLQNIGLYEDARLFCDWLETTEWFDCRGPAATAQWLGVTPEILAKLNSPIDQTLLRRFSRETRIIQGNPVWDTMHRIGEDLLDHVKSMRSRLDFLGLHGEFWDLDLSGRPPAKIFVLPRTEPLPDEPSLGTGHFIASRGLANEVVGVVYPDRRGQGYGLSRFQDNPRLDFTRIAGLPGVHFTHARGFMAKTSATDFTHLRKLLALADTIASPS